MSIHGFTKEGARRIVEAVRRIESEIQSLKTRIPSTYKPATRTKVRGKLDGTLTRGTQASPTSATLSVWGRTDMSSATAAMTDTSENITIVDDGMVPTSASPIAAGTWVQAELLNGRWCYCGHDCG